MPEEKQAETPVESAETKSTDTEVVDDSTLKGEPTEITPEEVIPTPKEEALEPKAESEPAEEKTDVVADEVDELSDFLGEPKEESKDGAQKRIDKLTADKYRMQAELDKYKADDRSKKPPSERVYSDSELDTAERKAMQDGDYDLMQTVRKERDKNLKASLRKEYLDVQKNERENIEKTQREWSTVKDSYQYLSAPMKPEIYGGSREELNISNPNSNLVRLARTLYSMDKGKIAEILGYPRDYASPGGQERAVADALRLILDKRRTQKSDSSETRTLKKQLTREKRKTSLGSAGAQKDETSVETKSQTPEDILAEVVAERGKWKADKIGY